MSDLTERARASDGYRVVKEPTGNYIKADTELIRELADRIDELEAALRQMLLESVKMRSRSTLNHDSAVDAERWAMELLGTV